MRTELILTITSTIFPIIASIIIAKKPRKNKNKYIKFLYFSLVLTIGLFINLIISGSSIEYNETEIVPPTFLSQGDTLNTNYGFSIAYENYEISTATNQLLISSSDMSKHVTFSITGQSQVFIYKKQEFILELIGRYPMNNDAIKINLNKIE